MTIKSVKQFLFSKVPITKQQAECVQWRKNWHLPTLVAGVMHNIEPAHHALQQVLSEGLGGLVWGKRRRNQRITLLHSCESQDADAVHWRREPPPPPDVATAPLQHLRVALGTRKRSQGPVLTVDGGTAVRTGPVFPATHFRKCSAVTRRWGFGGGEKSKRESMRALFLVRQMRI